VAKIDRRVLQDPVRRPQRRYLSTQPVQLLALLCRQQVTPAAAVGLPHPRPQRLLIDAQVRGDVCGGLSGILGALSHGNETTDWIRVHVEPLGGIRLVHERPWGTVRRVPVSGGVAWFKDCAPGQAFETRLTAALARRWPDRLPEVIAYDIERAWLLLGDAGEPLGFGSNPEPWLSILPLYAELQRGEATHAAEHLDGGVPDRRIASFPRLYETMLARQLPLQSGDLTRLRAFAARFAELCDELAAHDVTETIQHDDLHGANVYPRDITPRILDWGDSCISHPFLTMFVTFLHLETKGGLTCNDAWLARLRDAYLEPWGRSTGLHVTFELAQRLGPFAHAFKELRVLDAIPESDRPQFAPNLLKVLAGCVAAADLERARGTRRPRS
jgi:hypothetical protein